MLRKEILHTRGVDHEVLFHDVDFQADDEVLV